MESVSKGIQKANELKWIDEACLLGAPCFVCKWGRGWGDPAKKRALKIGGEVGG